MNLPNLPQVVEYDWNLIIERLAYHRKRLNISKEEMKTYIWTTYKCPFNKLTDRQIIDLGITLKETKHKGEIIF